MLRRARKAERGMTLVETLIAFLILFFVLIAVLEMFTMAYAVNMGSAARTDLTYRAQRVAEVIRTIYAFEVRQPTTFATLQTNSGVDLVAQMNSTVALPPTGTDSFWGSGWANVVEQGAPYELSYQVAPGTGGARWTVTVVAQARAGGSGHQYQGTVGPGKAVRYAASIP